MSGSCEEQFSACSLQLSAYLYFFAWIKKVPKKSRLGFSAKFYRCSLKNLNLPLVY